MASTESSQNDFLENEAHHVGEDSGGGVSLLLRLWTYGDSLHNLDGLALQQEPEIAQLIHGVIRDSKGLIPERQPSNLFSARFHDASTAAAAAKALQKRFLTYHRKTEPQQVVPCVLVFEAKNYAVSPPANKADRTIPDEVLAKVNSARILISQSVYDKVRNVPGFQFASKPVREAGQTGDPEAIYELLWTDESTYGQLRKVVRARFNSAGRYQLQEELGRGAMGSVHKAYDQLIGRTVALKIISIDRNTPDRDELIERLKQEAKAAGKLDHPNIITIYDVGEEDDLVYLSMQFLEGKTLLSLLLEAGVPRLDTLISWADQILSAVGYAHAHGVIHRDLKPANLMLTNEGIIKVLDFGIAKLENTSLTQTGLVVGTPSYMAPEQVAGKKVDCRADIFALGSIFYELMTREKPFRGDLVTMFYKIVNENPVAPSLVNPAIPGSIDAIIRKALSKEANDRFQTCGEMRNAFLEQAKLLNINPGTPVSLALPVTKVATQLPSTFSLHLLEDGASRRSTHIRSVLGGILTLVLIATLSWGIFSSSRTGSLPVIVKQTMAAFRRMPRLPLNHVKPEANGGKQPHVELSEQTSENKLRVNNDRDGVSSSAQTQTSSGNGTSGVKTEISPPGHDTLPTMPQAPVPPQPLSNQTSDAGGESASRPAPPVAEQETPSPNVPEQPVDMISMPAAQPGGEEQRPVESPAGAPKIAAEKQDSKKGVGSAAEASETAEPLATAAKSPKKASPPLPLVVEGFTRRDVPELLQEANVAEARGDYRLASYSYGLVLKLEPQNPIARSRLNHLKTIRQ